MTGARAPARAHESAAASLDRARLSPDRRDSFHLRLDRYWSDLSDAIGAVYADLQIAGQLTESLIVLAASAYADRADDLHRLDQERLLRPDWLQQPRMFGYACYTDRFAGSLPGVADHLDYLADLGVTYLHLMPLLRPRAGDNDGGYAVQDYRAIRPDLGTVDDLRNLAATLRSRGISLVVDLVLNHVAREHEWAVAARGGHDRITQQPEAVYVTADGAFGYLEALGQLCPAPLRPGLEETEELKHASRGVTHVTQIPSL